MAGEKKTTKKTNDNSSRTVVLPYEKDTKTYRKFSTLESRDREQAKNDTAVVSSVYIRKDKFPESKAARVTVEPVDA